MKKALYLISSVLFAVAVFSCNKDNPEEIGPEIITPGTPVTISLNIPEKGLTKVDLTQDADPDGPVKLAWESTDVITIKNAADENKSVVFDYVSGAGTTTASFTAVDASPLEGATSYNIYLSSGAAAAAEQEQAGDGSTAHLGYSATLRGVNKLSGATFSSDWAEAAENGSGTFVSSSVLRLRAQLPSGVAATVQAVTFKADQDIFLSGKTLKVKIKSAGDAGNDNILNVYATLPGGAVIPAGTNLLFQFQVSADENNLLTAHRLITPANTFNEGKVNALKISCPNIQSYANQSNESIGTISNPYLIGDRNQLAKIKDNLSTSEKRYFKLVDDITVSSWTSLNPSDNSAINFDGNDKTITGLDNPLFTYLDGEVYDLTLSDASISASGYYYGVLVRTIDKGDCSISKVSVESSSISAHGYVGGLIGRVTADVSSFVMTGSSSDVSVTGTVYGSTSNSYCGGLIGYLAEGTVTSSYATENVSAEGLYVGGLIGYMDNGTITNCSATGNVTSTSTATYSNCGGLIGWMDSGTLNKCHAEGDVISDQAGLGGLVGTIQGDASVLNCYATGNVAKGNTKYTYRGGLIGRISAGTVSISNCYATGEVEATRWSSGFVGSCDGTSLTITNGYTSSKLTLSTPAQAGVFIGNANKKAITYSGFVAWNTSALTNFIYNTTVTSAPSGNYFGTEGTILSRAQAFTAPNNWDFDTVWNSVNPPTLK